MPKGTGSNTAATGGAGAGPAGGGRRYDDFAAEGAHVAHGRDVLGGKLSSEEREAIREYTGDGFDYVNRYHRTPGDVDRFVREDAIEMTRKLDRVFARPEARFQANGAVYRGAAENSPMLKALNAGTLRPGDVFQDKAYASTSVNPTVARSFSANSGKGAEMMRTIVRIRVKKGQRGLHVQSASQHSSEAETLLARGSKFKVRSVEVRKTHRRRSGGKDGARPDVKVRQITVDLL